MGIFRSGQYKLLLILVPIVVIWILFSRMSTFSQYYKPLENMAMDWRFKVRGPLEVPEIKIAYVDVDAKAIKETFGERPWARHKFGQLAEFLIKYGEAKTVGFDILFTDQAYSDLVPLKTINEKNEELGAVVRAYKNQIVLAGNYTSITLPKTFEQRQLDEQTEEIKPYRAEFPLRYAKRISPHKTFPEIPSFPIIDHSTGTVGLISEDTSVNPGAVPRWIPIFGESKGPYYTIHFVDSYMRYLGLKLNEDVFVHGDFVKGLDENFQEIFTLPLNHHVFFYHFAVELALQYLGLTHENLELTDENLIIRDNTGEVKINVPLTYEQLMEINWFTAFPKIFFEYEIGRKVIHDINESAATVYQHGLNIEKGSDEVREIALDYFKQFKDTIVLVGPVDRTLQDLAPTPFDQITVPKVSMHANALKTIFSGKYIQRLPDWTQIVAIIVLTLSTTLLGTYSGRFSTIAKVFCLLTFAVYVFAVFFAFNTWHLVIPLVAPFFSAFMSTSACGLYQLIMEEKQKGRIKGMFGTYLSPDLVNNMVESGEEPQLGGQDATITAFFSDVQSFSSFSEMLEPTQLVDLMNEYLTAMTDILMEEAAYVDKYIGDAIVAMFNAPVSIEDHAMRGCIAAARVQKRQLELRQKWADEGEKWPGVVARMQTRIGLNTGHATVGNMGSENRFNYTMMGDTVNLAARCESGAKAYGAYIMVAEDTKKAAEKYGDAVIFRYLDRIIVKGRTQPVEMYEVVGLKEDVSEETLECLRVYQDGIDKYLAQEWDEAVLFFADSAQLELNQPLVTPGVTTNPSIVMIERCHYYREEPPGASWDGVYVMKTK